MNALGLTTQEASERLQRDGPNELPRAGPRSLVNVLWMLLEELKALARLQRSVRLLA